MKIRTKTYIFYTSKKNRIRRLIFKSGDIIDLNSFPKTIELLFDFSIKVDVEIINQYGEITGIKFILKSAKNPRKLIKEIGIDEFELI